VLKASNELLGMSIGFFCMFVVSKVAKKNVTEIHHKNVGLLRMATGTKIFNILKSSMLIPTIYLYALDL